MKAYEKIGWLDHVQDVETGEVIQEGTPVSQTNMNHMDDGIFANREAAILHEAQIADALTAPSFSPSCTSATSPITVSSK